MCCAALQWLSFLSQHCASAVVCDEHTMAVYIHVDTNNNRQHVYSNVLQPPHATPCRRASKWDGDVIYMFVHVWNTFAVCMYIQRLVWQLVISRDDRNRYGGRDIIYHQHASVCNASTLACMIMDQVNRWLQHARTVRDRRWSSAQIIYTGT